MSKLLFLDVEATGTEDEDRLCQVAYRLEDVDVNEFFKPPLPIKYTAMAVTHITNDMVADKPAFKGSETHTTLKKMGEDGVILVAHNAPYDLKMLAKEGVEFPRFIDTLKVVKHLDEDSELENHQLQYLRYLYGVEIEATAHDAFGDILVLEAVFAILFDQMQRKHNIAGGQDVIEKMIEISTQPSLVRAIRFGKYNGKTVAEVAKVDRGYLEWLLKEKKNNPEGEEDWIYTLNHYLA